MNITPLLAQMPSGWGLTAVAIVGTVIVVFVFALVWASRYTKVGPNQVLVVSGRQYKMVDADGSQHTRGFRIVKGGGTFHHARHREGGHSLAGTAHDRCADAGGLHEQRRAGESRWRRANQGEGRRHLHRHRVRAVPQQGHRRDQEHRDANDGRPSARDSRHDDRRGDLPEPRCLRAKGAGSRGRRHGEHGPRDRQLHDPRYPRHAGLSRCARQAAHRPGETRRADRPGRGGSRRDDQIFASHASRAGSQVRWRTRKSPRRSAITKATSRNTRPR